MAFFPELEMQSTDELIAGFLSDGPLPDGVSEDERILWFEECARAIAASGEQGLDFLIQCIAHADEFRLDAILSSVWFVAPELLEKRREEIRTILFSFLHNADERLVAQAVDSLSLLGDKEDEPRVLPLLRHDSPYVVGSVLRFLRRVDPESALPYLRQSLVSPDPIIRQNAVDELDELPCVAALPDLRRLLNDEDEDVRQAAETAVHHLEAMHDPVR